MLCLPVVQLCQTKAWCCPIGKQSSPAQQPEEVKDVRRSILYTNRVLHWEVYCFTHYQQAKCRVPDKLAHIWMHTNYLL